MKRTVVLLRRLPVLARLLLMSVPFLSCRLLGRRTRRRAEGPQDGGRKI